MDIRVLETIHQFEQASAIEQAVWAVEPGDAMPPHFLRACMAAGGVSLGAFDEDAMVGMAMAFPAFRESRVFLWSHMTGVLPTYQRQDIGFQLKQAQRVWALEHGIDQIRWTFDPMMRGNASFNLHRLGATARRYYVDFYGSMMDGLNKGLPTDRLEACWDLNDARAIAAADGEPPHNDVGFDRSQAILAVGAALEPIALKGSGHALAAEIPHTVRSLPISTQLQWRFAVRAALEPHLADGWLVVAFHTDADHAWYELRRV